MHQTHFISPIIVRVGIQFASMTRFRLRVSSAFVVIGVTIVLVTLVYNRSSWKMVAIESASMLMSLRIASSGRDFVAESSHCAVVVEKTKLSRKMKLPTDAAVVEQPPWIDLMTDDTDRGLTSVSTVQTVQSTNEIQKDREMIQRLYVNVADAETRRLGNQLFNFASLFGIAWRNRRIPLWPNRTTHLSQAFQLRVPVDRDNLITVSHA
jgi:hypothetical protein